MLRSNLWDYPDAYILVEGTIIITGVGADGTARKADERDKSVIIKNGVPFTKCIRKINGTDIGNVKDNDCTIKIFKQFLENTWTAVN